MPKPLERQITALPKEVVWCKNCLMSNQRPRISINTDGICSGCTNHKRNESIDWDSRESELVGLLDKHRSSTGDWDVIVPSSGGKDSAYVAHQLKYKYGMNPLTVTWAPLSYTDIGKKNFISHLDAGFSNITYTPNRKLQRKLARLCLEELGDAFHVFVLGQICFPFHMAVNHGISLVFYGENGELEYAGDPSQVDQPFKPKEQWLDSHFKGCTLDELIEYGLANKHYLNEDDINNADLKFYKPPSKEVMDEIGIKGKHYFGYYKNWSPQANYFYCTQHTGFECNQERTEGTYSRYASLDDMFDGFHYYMRYIKFGLGRCVEDASHEIRDGFIDRDEGLSLCYQFEGEFPRKYFKEFLDYLDISEESFYEIVDSWRLPHLWHKETSGEWTPKFELK